MTAPDILSHDDTLIYIETFTPDMAEKWLEENTGNRPDREQDVAKYARDMTAGNWYFTGDPIRRSNAGKLLDGQHRLMAVIKSGVTCEFLVVDGLQDHTQVVMDSGRKRTFGNQLAIRKEADANVTAATVRYLMLWEYGQPVHANYTPSHAEMNGYLDANPDVRISANIARHVSGLIKVAPRPIAAVHYTASRNAREAASEFFARLGDGAGLYPGSPIYTLRERFIRVRNNNERLDTPEYVALVILAWNAYREGRVLTKLQLPKGGLTNANFPAVRA